MFYSHEILTSHQFGVATIWVIATVGPRGAGTHKKVSRRAIEDVDIRKACEKIIQPGAPISLRLQSNLLYGVSRVYSSQCKYMLTDTEKVQTTMRTFLRLIANNETDPKAGRARREQITLSDDPGFVPTSVMPYFTIDEDGNPCFVAGSQPSSGSKNKSQSQLSPFPDPIDFLDDSGHGNSLFHLDFSQSPDIPDFRLPSPFAQGSAQKTLLPRSRDDMELDMNANPFGALDDFDNFGGVELAIDENGAVILDEHELELPELAGIDMGEVDFPIQHDQGADAHQVAGDVFAVDAQDAVPLLGSDPLPVSGDAPLVPGTPRGAQSDQAVAPSKKRRRIIKLDNGTQLSRSTLKSWQEDYLDNAKRANKRRKGNSNQAKENAYFFVFGKGIGGVGTYGADFPLAEMFAGKGLRDIIYGPPTEEEREAQTPSPKSRRRRAGDAFGEDGDGNMDRNVRPRVDETPQQGRSMDDDIGFEMEFGDDSMPEMGMEAGQPMRDNHSSSMMPWAQTPSVGRGSSVASHSAQRHSRQKSASIRGSSMPPFEPLHDAQHTDDFDALPFDMPASQDLASDGPAGILVDAQQEGENDSQWMRSMLDTASGEFLQWTEEEAKKTGQIKESDVKKNRRWVEFDDLIEPTKQNHVVAAQAFYHVLSLATKDAITVEQHVADLQPFGPIRIGVDMTAHINSEE
ncbi:Rec8 like protein-domain-containing protein [Colletotrichum phormii]|uniref:Rec8 like protein-domain-containing protein n=1 Tax=Colletotrichum phormii TaxID=359342 RepID=A0AAJ0A711_9PEZI|nr:Rec8 like protein-domain-containing protein [Colletotrichum phormii]KAK1656197.1 Rec8 like protein-domain-containing protein [Colletotrichum phormii]